MTTRSRHDELRARTDAHVAEYARIIEQFSEGYPGIAHDFNETKRALAAAEARAAELEAERTSLHRELAGLLGPITPRAGVTANDQWISKVAVICARAEKAEQALRAYHAFIVAWRRRVPA